MPMAGFDRRTGMSTGTLDELYVSALALTPDEGEPFVLCSFDLLGTDLALCRDVRAAVSSRLGIPDGRVWAGATHTHSGPSGIFRGRDNYCAEYCELLCARSSEAAERALRASAGVSVRTGVSSVPGVASLRDRAREQSRCDMPLLVTEFTGPGRRILLCRFSCHPTVLDERNTLWSRDLPGAIERALPAGTDCLFLNGACADLSTRYTRVRSDPEELERIGALAAEAIEGAHTEAAAGFGHTIRTARRTLPAPRGGGLSGQERQALRAVLCEQASACTDAAARRELEARLAVLDRPPAKPQPDKTVEVSAADLGPLILLALPFEVACGDGGAIEAELSAPAGKPVFAVCYTGGYDGYLPGGRPLDAGSSYQDLASRYDPALRSRLPDCARDCIKSLQ